MCGHVCELGLGPHACLNVDVIEQSRSKVGKWPWDLIPDTWYLRHFYLTRGFLSVTKNCTLQFCDWRRPLRLKHLTAIYPHPLQATYVITQRHRLVRPSLTNTGEQRGRGGLTNITISSQVACDHRKVLRAELVSTPPDGLDTLTRSSEVRKR